MKTALIGFPRVGESRELKFTTEAYFKGEKSEAQLLAVAAQLRQTHWLAQQASQIDFIPSNDFSFYDTVLDTACLLNIIPARYRTLSLSALDQYFAMARGYQGTQGDVKALAMKKWFNTNYHYLEPELDDLSQIKLVGQKPFNEFNQAKALGIESKPVILGPFTLLKLTRIVGKKGLAERQSEIVAAYQAIIQQFSQLGARWLQFDEPSLVTDLTAQEIAFFNQLYQAILPVKGNLRILLQTYFGDIRDSYQTVTALPFDGIGLDFVEGKHSFALVNQFGFPRDKVLFAGLINGKNIWKNNYQKTLENLKILAQQADQIVLSSACSLLHVPYTLKYEDRLNTSQKRYFAFAHEKLDELYQLKTLAEQSDYSQNTLFKQNLVLFSEPREGHNHQVQQQVAALTEADFTRLPAFDQREPLQQKTFNLPLLPTTTIGSFPQTADVRLNRAKFRQGEISQSDYITFNRQKIADCIHLQEQIGLDVLVHGEFERNDMVEYFGESLSGFVFTEKAWVQSYGTRCVKPPIVWGDIARAKPITVDYSSYAQSLTTKPVKGMLTGPVTILNWSFPREDISHKTSVFQIALAIQAEVLDLEAAGLKIIQIDEAALKEKLPLRRADWHSEYLDWAIPAFRLVHSKVKATTQIHTHMCYSEFTDIISDIDNMDADVISFEASRSNLAIIDALNANHFKTEVGPGVYDIHSPRVPSVSEIQEVLEKMLTKIAKHKLWVNPDCGLKTRGEPEVIASLTNLVAAASEVRKGL